MVVELQELEARLVRLVRSHPDLSDAVELQRALLREASRVAPRARPPLLPRQRALQKLEQGIPLLHGEDVDPDRAICRDVFDRLLNVFQDDIRHAAAAHELAAAVASGRLDFEQALAEALASHEDHLLELATWLAVPADALVTSLELAARQSLEVIGAALRPLLDAAPPWPRGYCPVCGTWPGLAELGKTEQRWRLRCLRCGSAWAMPGEGCPYCGNTEPAKLGTLQVGPEPRERVQTCARCSGYLKVVEPLDSTIPGYLALEDLASLALDLAAREQGCARPRQAGFRIELAGGDSNGVLDDLLEAD